MSSTKAATIPYTVVVQWVAARNGEPFTLKDFAAGVGYQDWSAARERLKYLVGRKYLRKHQNGRWRAVPQNVGGK